MEEDEEPLSTIKIETVEIECKIEIEEQTEIKAERDSDTDDGSHDGSQSDANSNETTSQGIKRNKENKGRNKKKKKEENSTDDEIEEVQSNDPLDVSEELNDNDQLNDPTTGNDTQILEHFTRWQHERQLPGYTEDVFLSYFKELERRVRPAALWSAYCALKAALAARAHPATPAPSADLNTYHKLKYYVRKVTDGFREKESRVFTADDIKKFLKTASDDTHLAWKVAVIIGVTGGCRCNELRNLTVDDVKLHGDKALVQIQESSKKQRSYVISENYSHYIKKYLGLRPKNSPVKRLLLPCKYNEFSKRAMGKKKIGAIPTGVARFLKLPHADEYTGHTYRRTFALFNPLKQSNTINSDGESDNEIDNLDNNDIDNKRIDNLDNRNRRMPVKVYKKFLEVHDAFKQWMKRLRVPYIFEDCVLTYFRELAKNYKPMSLWKLFSMLRYTLLIKDKLDIRSYSEVTEYLRGGVPGGAGEGRSAGAFCAADLDVFMREAPDHTYLGTKVALLLGVSGACNCQELMNITIDNVKIYGTTIVVKVKDSNKKNKIFIIPDNYYEIVKKYIDLRPKDMIFDKFLILFKNGKYTRSVMGRVLIRSVPRDVASYLNISNADEYTGHYLRRTAFVLFNLTTISIINDSDDSDNEEYESDNDNKVDNSDNKIDNCDNKVKNFDNKVEISDNKVGNTDKLYNKCSSQNLNATIKHNHNDIDNKSTVNNKVDAFDNKYTNRDLEEDLFEVTPDIVEDQSNVDNNTKPGWHPRYDEIYNYFMRWSREKSTKSFSEDIMLMYFKELSEKFKPSTLWSQFYVLRRTLIIKNDVDISDYDELKDFLKKKADGFRSTKSRVFTVRQIDDFLEKAPDEMYLHWKVALILGIKGACKCTELLNLTTEHIKLQDNMITVKVQETRNRKRKFFISDHYFPYVKKYIDLRPTECKTDRFLLLIKNKKVIKACVGKHTINNMPKEIANYLNLPFPEEYNGHCFRTTSMTLFSHDSLVRSDRQAGQLSNAMEDFSRARNEVERGRNEAYEAGRGKNGVYEAERGTNEAKVVSWPENDGKRALCWPLTIEKDDEFGTDGVDESGGEQWTLNSESGVFEIVDHSLRS